MERDKSYEIFVTYSNKGDDMPISKSLNKKQICNLPWDMKFNVLSRLSVKDLCTLNCVSQEWCNTICDCCFRDLYNDQSRNNTQLLLLDHFCGDFNVMHVKHAINLSSVDMEQESVKYGFKKLVDGCVEEMLSSGFGLVCFVFDHCHYCVCNPSTQEFVSLPDANLSSNEEVNAAFGYLPSTNEYKLVHLFNRSPCTSDYYDIGCEILTLSDGNKASSHSWRVVKENFHIPVMGLGVLVNNVSYWMISDEYYDHLEEDELIISFQMEEEKFEIVHFPDILLNKIWSSFLLVGLRGILCLVRKIIGPRVMEIWMMKDFKNNVWEREYIINLAVLDAGLRAFRPLCYWNGEIVIKSGGEILYYNTESKCFRMGKILDLCLDTEICIYTESFFSLGSRET